MKGTTSKSAQHFWLTLVGFAIFAVAFYRYYLAERDIDRANEGRFNSFILADELRQSSDDLTRMMRTYVATRNPIYKDHYHEILEIREGRKPRPVDAYNVYWDLVLSDDQRPRPFGPAVPLLELMRRAGFTHQELAKLAEAKAASDALTRTEHAAMALVEVANPTQAEHLKATMMLYDAAYRNAKADIMRPIAQFHAMASERTVQGIRAAERGAFHARLWVLGTGTMLFLLLWRQLSSIQREKQAKAKGEALFRAVFDNAAVGLAQIDTQNRILNVNQEFCRIVGRTGDELCASSFDGSELTEPEDRPADIANRTRLLEGKDNHYALTKRYRHKDGRLVWVNQFVYLLKGIAPESSSTFIIAVVDVTTAKEAEAELERYRQHLEHLVDERTAELKLSNEHLKGEILAHQQAVAALQESEGRFRFIAENTGDVIWIVDIASEKFTYMSPSVQQLRGFTAAEVVSQPIDAAMTPESAKRIREALMSTVRAWNTGERDHTKRVTEIDQPHRDGHIIHTEVVTTLHADEQGRPVAILGVTRDVTERKRAEQVIRDLAFHDGLTKLPNRRLLQDRLEQAMARAKRAQCRIALLFIDLNRFKPINDELGHHVGDWLLQAVAERLLSCIRESDTAARVGGDEFIVLLPDVTLSDDGVLVAERIRLAIERPYITPEGERIEITSSIGVALYPDHASNERDLIRVGDESMYLAKRSGKNSIEMLPLPPLSQRYPTLARAFVHVTWKDDYACGQSAIDYEHRNLFRLVNRLLDCAMRESPESVQVLSDLEALLEALDAHFQTEENILKEKHYGKLDEHVEQHRRLLEQASTLRQHAMENNLSMGELVEFLAVEVITKHMLDADCDFFPLFSKNRPFCSIISLQPRATSKQPASG